MTRSRLCLRGSAPNRQQFLGGKRRVWGGGADGIEITDGAELGLPNRIEDVPRSTTSSARGSRQ